MDFYAITLNLMLEDYKKNGITIEEADRLYKFWNITTIYKNGKVEFINE